MLDIGGNPVVAKKTNPPMLGPLQSCRHNTTTFILVVHEWVNAFAVQIRPLVNALFLFPGLNEIQLRYIGTQIAPGAKAFSSAFAQLRSEIKSSSRACLRIEKEAEQIDVLITMKTPDVEEEDESDSGSD
jgi:hypothetical protein